MEENAQCSGQETEAVEVGHTGSGHTSLRWKTTKDGKKQEHSLSYPLITSLMLPSSDSPDSGRREVEETKKDDCIFSSASNSQGTFDYRKLEDSLEDREEREEHSTDSWKRQYPKPPGNTSSKRTLESAAFHKKEGHHPAQAIEVTSKSYMTPSWQENHYTRSCAITQKCSCATRTQSHVCARSSTSQGYGSNPMWRSGTESPEAESPTEQWPYIPTRTGKRYKGSGGKTMRDRTQ